MADFGRSPEAAILRFVTLRDLGHNPKENCKPTNQPTISRSPLGRTYRFFGGPSEMKKIYHNATTDGSTSARDSQPKSITHLSGPSPRLFVVKGKPISYRLWSVHQCRRHRRMIQLSITTVWPRPPLSETRSYDTLETLSLTVVKNSVSRQYKLRGTTKVADILQALPLQYRRPISQFLQTNTVRTASSIGRGRHGQAPPMSRSALPGTPGPCALVRQFKIWSDGLKAVEGGSRVLAGDHAKCIADD
jgi:hypothetical protein